MSLPFVLPLVPNNSPSGLRDYRTRLSEVTADPAWSKPAATIGIPLPAPSNCWITSDQFDDEPNAPQYPDDSATEARDKLGLIDNGEGKFLLRLSFLASSLANLPGNELARPVFSDLGNSRFRVHQSSSRAKIFAQQGWGATTHLGKLSEFVFLTATAVFCADTDGKTEALDKLKEFKFHASLPFDKAREKVFRQLAGQPRR